LILLEEGVRDDTTKTMIKIDHQVKSQTDGVHILDVKIDEKWWFLFIIYIIHSISGHTVGQLLIR
jgi:hypothetical protein